MDGSEESAKMEKKRGFILKEIISTEVTYVERLKFLVEVVVAPLKENNLLDANDMVAQFSILEKICALHSQNSFTVLETSPERFGEQFDNICDNAKIYADYLVGYEGAMARRCSLLLSNRRFSDFLDKAEKDPRLQCQKIESIFILPVQRIPRYRLLLEQLLKSTPEGHPQYDMVNTALEKICAMATYSNEAIRKQENRAKIFDIIKSIEPTTRVDLLADPDRLFIKEGPLLRQCRRGLKEFQFWLLNDQLLYGQPTPLGLFILNRQIALSKCFVRPCESMHENGHSFIVESPAKSFIICTSSEAEKTEWLEAIQQAIVALSQERNSKNKDAKQNIAPLWMPDSTAAICQKCRAAFSLISRRHHCRNCGAIVCDACSKGRYKLEHVDQRKQVRVCDGCYAYLSTGGKRSVRLDSLRAKNGVNLEGGEEEDTELHVSDEEMDNELAERNGLDEDDLYDFNEAMMDGTSQKSMHDQVLAGNANTTFRAEGEVNALPSSLLQKMSKSFSDVMAFGNPGLLMRQMSGGPRGSATAGADSPSTPSTSSYQNSPVSSGSAKVGASQSGYTTTPNPAAASPAGAGGSISTDPPAASPQAPAASPVPARAPAPPSRGIFKSASAFVTSGSTFLGNAAMGTSSSSSSTTASAAAPSAPGPTPPPKPARRATTTGLQSPLVDGDAAPDASVDASPDPAGGAVPPPKPPKPAKMNRRTNVCITVDPAALELAVQEEEAANA